jgi:bacillithiol disulfide reductase
MSVRDVLIVGAGPSGLAAAIAAKQQGLDYVLVEKGVLVNAIFNFPTHMVFFTTPELLEIGGLPLVTPYDKPTRFEGLRYYRRVVDTYGLQISFHERVVAIDPPSLASRASAFAEASADRRDSPQERTVQPALDGRVAQRPDLGEGGSAGKAPDEEDAFAVTTEDARGTRRVRHARAVVLAIGYYDHPNYLGVPGEDLPHVSHYYTDAHPYYRQRVVIVGGKNSAAEAALELFRAGAHVTLVHRRPTLGDSIKYWVRPDIDNRIKEGSVSARFSTCVIEITRNSVIVVRVAGGLQASGSSEAVTAPAREEIPAEQVFLLTGYKPDIALMRRAGVVCHPETLSPELNPETFETNVPNLFVAGGAIAGRNTGSIFIENGRFHGERIVQVLSQRLRQDGVR